MGNGNEEICAQVRSALNAHSVKFEESEIQSATKFTVQSGANTAALVVYSTGTITPQGKESPLKVWLKELKESVDSGTGSPAAMLPAEIEKFPQTLRERVSDCDDVILWFFQEALRCYKADRIAGAAFMLGAASEKAVLLLIEVYGNSIVDEKIKEKYFGRVNNRAISKKYEEFQSSYNGCKSKPVDQLLAHDLSQLLEGAFNFYRHTRNEVGPPQIIPDLDKGVVLANLGQFITYVERIYGLKRHFEEHGVEV